MQRIGQPLGYDPDNSPNKAAVGLVQAHIELLINSGLGANTEISTENPHNPRANNIQRKKLRLRQLLMILNYLKYNHVMLGLKKAIDKESQENKKLVATEYKDFNKRVFSKYTEDQQKIIHEYFSSQFTYHAMYQAFETINALNYLDEDKLLQANFLKLKPLIPRTIMVSDMNFTDHLKLYSDIKQFLIDAAKFAYKYKKQEFMDLLDSFNRTYMTNNDIFAYNYAYLIQFLRTNNPFTFEQNGETIVRDINNQINQLNTIIPELIDDEEKWKSYEFICTHVVIENPKLWDVVEPELNSDLTDEIFPMVQAIYHKLCIEEINNDDILKRFRASLRQQGISQLGHFKFRELATKLTVADRLKVKKKLIATLSDFSGQSENFQAEVNVVSATLRKELANNILNQFTVLWDKMWVEFINSNLWNRFEKNGNLRELIKELAKEIKSLQQEIAQAVNSIPNNNEHNEQMVIAGRNVTILRHYGASATDIAEVKPDRNLPRDLSTDLVQRLIPPSILSVPQKENLAKAIGKILELGGEDCIDLNVEIWRDILAIGNQHVTWSILHGDMKRLKAITPYTKEIAQVLFDHAAKNNRMYNGENLKIWEHLQRIFSSNELKHREAQTIIELINLIKANNENISDPTLKRKMECVLFTYWNKKSPSELLKELNTILEDDNCIMLSARPVVTANTLASPDQLNDVENRILNAVKVEFTKEVKEFMAAHTRELEVRDQRIAELEKQITEYDDKAEAKLEEKEAGIEEAERRQADKDIIQKGLNYSSSQGIRFFGERKEDKENNVPKEHGEQKQYKEQEKRLPVRRASVPLSNSI
jgi:hypothetical protein